MLTARTLINLSKHIEKIIYRSPNKDQFGYLTLAELLLELNNHPAWEYINIQDISEVVKKSTLKRLEISGNKIRLIIPRQDSTAPLIHTVIPPKKLYYGTTVVGISRIKTFGLRSYKDKYIKLYPDKRMVQVLVHRVNHVAIAEIDAMKAHKNNISFLKGDLNTYLAEFIPPEYIIKII